MNILPLIRFFQRPRYGAETPRRPRSLGLGRFHGQVERLEGRMVLSVSLGVSSVDVDGGAPEDASYFLESPARSFHQQVDSLAGRRWDAAATTPLFNRPEPPRSQFRTDGNDNVSLFEQRALDAASDRTYVIIVVLTALPRASVQHDGLGELAESPWAATYSPSTASPLALTNPVSGGATPITSLSPSPLKNETWIEAVAGATGGFPFGRLGGELPGDQFAPVALSSRSPVDAAPVVALPAGMNDDTVASTDQDLSVNDSRDEFFGSYGQATLLRTSDFDGSLKPGAYDAWDDLASSEEEQEENEGLWNPSGRGNRFADSLAELQQELVAVDVVLEQLHDFPDSRQQHDERAEADSRAGANRASRDAESASSSEASREVEAELSVADASQGGMVLLETAGDANVSAYDLVSVLVSDQGPSVEISRSVEAAVGVFQAFDLGGAEAPTPNTNQVAGGATPTSAGG